MSDLTFNPLIPGALWLVLAVVGTGLLAWYAIRPANGTTRARWGVIVGLMSIAWFMVLGLLLNPTWQRELPGPAGKPMLTVLVDTSGSMSTPDGADGKTRRAVAADVAGELHTTLANQFDVRVRAFDSTLRAVGSTEALASETDPVDTAAVTDISSALVGALTEDVPAGQAVVLLSDGIDTTAGASSRVLGAVRVAKAMGAPVFTQTIGGEVNNIDLAVDIRSPQDLAVVGQKLPLTVHVRHTGLTAGKATAVLLRDGKEIASREAVLAPRGGTDVHFLLTHDEVGVYPYEVRVNPMAGEASKGNNSASYVVRVVDEPIRVLVLEGKPYWDGKFLVRTLMSDPAVALDSVVRLTDKRLLRRTLAHDRSKNTDGPQDASPAPTTAAAVPSEASVSTRVETWTVATDAGELLANPDRLRGYQVVVLGRDSEAFLTEPAVNNLADWVAQQGGALLCYRGSPTAAITERMAKLMPVRWAAGSAPGGAGRFRMGLTDQGKDMNWFGVPGESGSTATGSSSSNAGDALRALPSLASSRVIESTKPLAVVLATTLVPEAQPTGTTAAPAVVYQQYGAGRVVVVEGAGMWRWAFLAPQYQSQDGTYAALWHSMLRWLTSGGGLTPGQSLSLRVDKVRFEATELATATLLARDDVSADRIPQVTLSLASNSERATQPVSELATTFTPSPVGAEPGVYRVNFGKLPEGRYRATLTDAKKDDASATVVFDVRKFDQEMIDLHARPELMARIAADSGGAALVAGSASANDIAKRFTDHMKALHPPRYERASAWDRWWVLVAIIVLWGVSWAVRRSGGLV